MRSLVIGVGVLFGLFLILVFAPQSPHGQSTIPIPPALAAKAPHDLRSLEAAGVIEKVDGSGDVIEATVGPGFYAFSLDQKRGVAYTIGSALSTTGRLRDVVFRDGQTDVEVATCYGGRLVYEGRKKN
jgi:hypothetical protein